MSIRSSLRLSKFKPIAYLCSSLVLGSFMFNAQANDNFLPCMVSDTGSFTDRSFNQLSLEGLENAAKMLGIEHKKVQSSTENDFAGNLSGLIDEGCNLVIGVGFLLADTTKEAAQQNPDIKFAIVDVADTGVENLKSIVFNTAEASFLAGYIAADTSKTGVVGTYGGMQIPSVTIFMDGYVQGVDYYNKVKNKSVKVIGWDLEKQNGLFSGGFSANESAKSTSKALIDQGVDVFMPVGGANFISAAEAIIDSKKDIALIGVDSDLFESEPKYRDLYLTSVLKKLNEGVKETVIATSEGKFNAESYIGTLKNKGVDVAPFHEWEGKVSSTLSAEIEDIRAKIIAGEIVITSPSTP